MTDIVLSNLTEGTLAGNGVFDRLMAAARAHLDREFDKNRITGNDYAQVYLGQMQTAMEHSLSFLLQSQKVGLEVQLLEQQVLLAQKQVQQADAQLALTQSQKSLVDAQEALARQQALNAVSEKALTDAQASKVNAEVLNVPKQGLMIEAQTGLVNQQVTNAVQENKNLVAQECLLKAQYDNTLQTTLRVTQETALTSQKVISEKAQTQSLGVDDNSVIGKQKGLYQAQTDGFSRDAEQKAAKLLIDTWNVRRTTDEGTVADGTNKLDDTTIGRAVSKVLAGINA